MKIYHLGSKDYGNEMQFIFAASDNSEGINDMEEVYAQITVWKDKKTVEILVPKEWSVKTNRAPNEGVLHRRAEQPSL
jgi:hypothetical protein